MTVGFIGLGRMGRGMALNLRKAGTPLLVYDLSREAIDTLAAAGAEAAGSVVELARRCQVVFTSLPGPAEIEPAVLGEDGLLANARRGLVLFDLSTNSLALIRRMGEAFARAGCTLLDAPVSGGPAGAASGDLVLWVGGDKPTFDRHLSLLEAFANAPSHVGALGTGTVTKLAHNMLGYTIMLAQAEVFSMAAKAGVDPLALWESLRLGVVGKRSPLDMLVNQFLPGAYQTPAFALRLAHKDVTLATNLAREVGVPMRLSALTLEDMTEALDRGLGDWDSRAFLQLQLERAGVEIAVEPDRLKAAVDRVQREPSDRTMHQVDGKRP